MKLELRLAGLACVVGAGYFIWLVFIERARETRMHTRERP